jgi:hypothetical protein
MVAVVVVKLRRRRVERGLVGSDGDGDGPGRISGREAKVQVISLRRRREQQAEVVLVVVMM